jgi:hypothetical protein
MHAGAGAGAGAGGAGSAGGSGSGSGGGSSDAGDGFNAAAKGSGLVPPALGRKRVEVVYGPTRFSFVWTRTTPPAFLLQKLCRSLDPSADPRLLVLIDSDGDECDLCDAVENNAVLTARFLDFHSQGWFSVPPSVVAEVVGVTRPVSKRRTVRSAACCRRSSMYLLWLVACVCHGYCVRVCTRMVVYVLVRAWVAHACSLHVHLTVKLPWGKPSGKAFLF